MQIPDSMWIGPFFIEIEKLDERNLSDLGNYNSWFGVIRVQKDLDEIRQAETFLHEIIHGVNSTWTLGLDEAGVRRFSIGLFDAIRRNNLDFRNPVQVREKHPDPATENTSDIHPTD